MTVAIIPTRYNRHTLRKRGGCKSRGRREILLGLGSLALGACAGGGGVPAAAPANASLRIDPSFATLALDALTVPSVRAARRAELLTHPALAALVRHRRMSSGGASDVDASALLEEILGKVQDADGPRRVLAEWLDREARLEKHITAAGDTLPADWRFGGKLFFVVGYDIGVASPPDVTINVAHPHFVTAPSEIGYYATHEAHHVGFMAARGTPPMDDLERADGLRALVQYMTQLEGMAVHAAYAGRARDFALDADEDYAVYRDEVEAARIIEAYASHRAAIPRAGRVPPETIGQVLEAMSSGGRLAYRFGALVARSIEDAEGREALVRSIRAPEVFDRAALRLAGLG